MMHQQSAVDEIRGDDYHDRGINSDVDDNWPMCKNVLRSLSENVQLTTTDNHDAAVVAAVVDNGVKMCLAECVTLTVTSRRLQLPQQWKPKPQDDPVVAAARRMQVRLMAVRSAYTDGKYYSPETPYVSQTVEELQTMRSLPANDHIFIYIAGTVIYDKSACHLHGFANPRSRLSVDYSLLTATLPRHQSTIKMYSTIRKSAEGTIVLVPHHFQTFSFAAIFH